MTTPHEWPTESLTAYRQRKSQEWDETIERLEWEAKRAIDNLHKYRREVDADLRRMEAMYDSK